jgi:hypothetical protein
LKEIGLGAKRQLLPLDEVPTGKFDRGVDQSCGSGAIQGWSLGVHPDGGRGEIKSNLSGQIPQQNQVKTPKLRS